MAKTPKKIGRPSKFSEEIANHICAELPFADGGLAEVCRADGMPHEGTVYRWLADPERYAFREAYAHARELSGEVQATRGLRDALEAEDAALGRLRFDARKWTAAKLAPKKYGDKVAHVGGDPEQGDKPIQTQGEITVRIVRPGDVEPA
jgi:hypothetical protein